MATFKDKDGREWNVALDAPKIMQIRAECDPRFLLNDAADENTYDRLDADSVLLCRVIFILCREQRQSREITEEAFYSTVIGNGDAIDAATEAMLQAILAFTRGRARTLLETLAQKQTNVQRLLSEKALARINDPELEKRIIAEAEARIDAVLATHMTLPLSATGTPGS